MDNLPAEQIHKGENSNISNTIQSTSNPGESIPSDPMEHDLATGYTQEFHVTPPPHLFVPLTMNQRVYSHVPEVEDFKFSRTQFNPENLKTLLCKKRHTDCKYKLRPEKCFFAHSSDDLKVNFTNERFKHERCRNQPSCTHGDSCYFLHDNEREVSLSNCGGCMFILNSENQIIVKLFRKPKSEYSKCECFDQYEHQCQMQWYEYLSRLKSQDPQNYDIYLQQIYAYHQSQQQWSPTTEPSVAAIPIHSLNTLSPTITQQLLHEEKSPNATNAPIVKAIPVEETVNPQTSFTSSTPKIESVHFRFPQV